MLVRWAALGYRRLLAHGTGTCLLRRGGDERGDLHRCALAGSADKPAPRGEASRYLHTLALFVVPACLATALLAATRGLGTMRAGVLVEQVGRQLAQLVIVSIAVAATSTRWIGWAWALPYLGSFLAALLWCRRLRRWWCSRGGRVNAAVTGSGVLAVHRTRTLASVAQLLLQRVDIVLVAALAGAADAALFTASTRFVVVGQAAGYAISLALQPQLASELAREDLPGARRLFQTSAAWLVGFTWPLYLTFCVHGRELLSVFGGGYHSGATILALVSCGLLVGTAVGDVDSVLVMSGRTMLSMANTVLGLAVMIGLDLWLIPRHGALGAAFGWGGALVVKNLAGLVQVHRVYRMHPFSVASALAMGLSAACFGGISGGARLLVGTGLWALVSGLLLSGLALPGGALACCAARCIWPSLVQCAAAAGGETGLSSGGRYLLKVTRKQPRSGPETMVSWYPPAAGTGSCTAK